MPLSMFFLPSPDPDDPEDVETSPPNLSPLCNSCQSIFNKARIPHGGGVEIKGTFTQSLVKLEKSSHRCHLCWIRLSLMSHDGRHVLSERDDIEYDDDEYELYFSIPEATNDEWHSRPFAILRQKLKLCRSLFLMGEPGLSAVSSTKDPKTFGLINTWIRRCQTQHQACIDRRSAQNARYRPKRVLDLGPNNGTDIIRLCLGDSLRETTDFRYMTLSYRWGDKQSLQLRSSTAAQLYEGGSVHYLPPLFRDAVEIARRLKVQYIWIDSLCIEQDSKDDWNMVTADMGAVYNNSWLNLAAVNARNSHDTCFVSRPDFGLRPLRVKCLRGTKWVFETGTEYAWRRDVLDNPFSGRAWILQERYLATRVLSFTKTEVYWECCTSCSSESSDEVFRSNSDYTGPYARTRLQISETVHRPDHRFTQPGRTRIWMEIVEEYSRCTLTNVRKDKFAAVAGIAESLGSPEDYIAGLWVSDLLPLLLWHKYADDADEKAGTTEKKSIDMGQLAPSWSWLSVDTPVSFTSDHALFPEMLTRMALLLESHVEPMDIRYPFCDVRPGGHIILSVHILLFYSGRFTADSLRYWPDNRSSVVEAETSQYCAILFGSNDELQAICLEHTGTKGTYRRRGQVSIEVTNWKAIEKFLTGDIDDEHEDSYIERLEDKTYNFENDEQRVRLKLPTYKIKII